MDGSLRHLLLAVLAAGTAAAGCGGGRQPEFCGLVRTPGGYDPVEVRSGDLSCRAALRLVAAVERAAAGSSRQSVTTCSRGAGRSPYELACRTQGSVVWILERPPVRPENVVTSGRRLHARLANWEFALEADRAYAREANGRWRLVSRGSQVCVDVVPGEVLRAWRLRRLTPAGGCYASTGRRGRR